MKIRLILWSAVFAILSLTANAQEVFVPTSKGDIAPLTRAVVMGNKTSGASFLAAYGAKLTTSLVLDGKYANTILPRLSTVFYVLTPKNISIQSWKLIPLKTKKKNRELPFMKTGAYSGSKTNLDDIPLMSQQIAEDIYELRPMGELKTGDYALAYITYGVLDLIFDFRVEANLPPYPNVSKDVILAEFNPGITSQEISNSSPDSELSSSIIRWYFDSDPRGARVFYRVISNVPKEVKNTNESYMTTTPLEETKSLNIPGLTYEN